MACSATHIPAESLRKTHSFYHKELLREPKRTLGLCETTDLCAVGADQLLFVRICLSVLKIKFFAENQCRIKSHFTALI